MGPTPSGGHYNCGSSHPSGNAEHLGCGFSSGMLVRFKLDDFTLGGVDSFNMTSVNKDYRGFFGAFTDGKNGFLIPDEWKHANYGPHHKDFIKFPVEPHTPVAGMSSNGG